MTKRKITSALSISSLGDAPVFLSDSDMLKIKVKGKRVMVYVNKHLIFDSYGDSKVTIDIKDFL